MPITHRRVSTIPDDANEQLIRPSDWNAEHEGQAEPEEHGNEKHNPDFEQEGMAAALVEIHRTTETHTQDQPPIEHGNEKHNPDFATEEALINHEGNPSAHHPRYTNGEAAAVAAVVVEAHRTDEIHTQPQPPETHGNEAHDVNFEQEGISAIMALILG
jgi:uncharacterized protein YkuJ